MCSSQSSLKQLHLIHRFVWFGFTMFKQQPKTGLLMWEISYKNLNFWHLRSLVAHCGFPVCVCMCVCVCVCGERRWLDAVLLRWVMDLPLADHLHSLMPLMPVSLNLPFHIEKRFSGTDVFFCPWEWSSYLAYCVIWIFGYHFVFFPLEELKRFCKSWRVKAYRPLLVKWIVMSWKIAEIKEMPHWKECAQKHTLTNPGVSL